KKYKRKTPDLARNERRECSAKSGVLPGSNDSGRVETDVHRKRKDLSFRKEVVNAYDSLTRGEKGLYLRKLGLYAAQVSLWRNDLNQSKKSNRKLNLEEEIAALKKQNEKLKTRNKTLEGLIELQKKMAEICSQQDL